ncbi:MAG: hypothetical protein FD153_1028 [Rhodospirillaceae bacterium]|nr:MAG: hypothetical protein FD153_1028 [Rhodospirillaceae bacterium]
MVGVDGTQVTDEGRTPIASILFSPGKEISCLRIILVNFEGIVLFQTDLGQVSLLKEGKSLSEMDSSLLLWVTTGSHDDAERQTKPPRCTFASRIS